MVSRFTTRLAVAALLTASAGAALAQPFDQHFAPAGRPPVLERMAPDGLPAYPDDVLTTGSIGLPGAPLDRCFGDSAAEGNANQQTRPVKQYGQTTGGYRC